MVSPASASTKRCAPIILYRGAIGRGGAARETSAPQQRKWLGNQLAKAKRCAPTAQVELRTSRNGWECGNHTCSEGLLGSLSALRTIHGTSDHSLRAQNTNAEHRVSGAACTYLLVLWDGMERTQVLRSSKRSKSPSRQ